MAITIVQTAVSSAWGKPATAAFANPVTPGNTIVAVIAAQDNGPVPTLFNAPTDNKGNVYHTAVKAESGSIAAGSAIYYAYNVAGGAGLTVSETTNDGSCCGTPIINNAILMLYEVAGLTTTDPLDKTAHGTSIAGSPTSGNTPATSQASELLVGALGTTQLTGSGAPVAGAGFINLLTPPAAGTFWGAAEAKIVSAVGAYAATFTTNGGQWGCAIATFKAATATKNSGFLTLL